MTELYITEYDATGKVLTSPHVGEWCRLPYPDHPKGCPNYNRKDGCPPNAPFVWDVFDEHKIHGFVVAVFSMNEYLSRMRQQHPDWTERQLRCVLYWQGKVKKILRETCEAMTISPSMTYTLCPEGMGVMVIKTLKRMGIDIRAKPNGVIYKVALLGYKSQTTPTRRANAPSGASGHE